MEAKFSQILTIGVPVFEEQEGLSRTLASIEGLTEFKSGDIQVVVWDNHSGDETYKVALEFATRNPTTVHVGTNSSNIGLVGNLLQVLRTCRSKFVWILGAGEEITTSTLLPILEFLANPNNNEIAMGVVTAETSHELLEPENDWKILKFNPESESCFAETISLSIVDRNIALAVLDADPPEKKGIFHLWPHLEVALAATSYPTFKIDCPSLVKISENPTGWWYHGPSALDVYLNQVNLLRSHRRNVEWIKAQTKHRCGWHFAKFAFEIKLEGAGLKAFDLQRAVKAGINLGPAAIALLVALSPKAALRVIQIIYRRTQKR
jgi:glycosyltransferase involved in cell wall biosynthesis